MHLSGSDKAGLYSVAVILVKYHSTCVVSANYINDRIITIKLNTLPMTIVQVYAHTSASTPEYVEEIV